MLETNGSKDISVLPDEVIKIVDCKTPSSGVSEQMNPRVFDCLSEHDEVKFVIGNREDYDYTLSVIAEHKLQGKTKKILLSPMWKMIEPMQIVEWMLVDRPPARLQIQMHKVIWNPDKRGV